MFNYIKKKPLPQFEMNEADYAVIADLMMTRVPYLSKMADRGAYENTTIRSLKANLTKKIKGTQDRVLRIAGHLYMQAIEAGDETAQNYLQLSQIYQARDDLKTALHCAKIARNMSETPDVASRREVELSLQITAGAQTHALIDSHFGEGAADQKIFQKRRFVPWANASGTLITFDSPTEKTIATDCIAIQGGHVNELRYTAGRVPLLASLSNNITLRSELVPIYDDIAYFHDFNPSLDQLGMTIDTRTNVLYCEHMIRKTIEEPVIVLTGNRWHFQNYYHCLIQNIMRLALLHDDPAYSDFKVLLPSFAKPWVFSLLELVGITSDQIIRSKPQQITTLRHALVFDYQRVPNKAAVDAFRQMVGVPDKAMGERRIFAGRREMKQTNTRSLQNESILADISEEFGFEFIDFTAISVAEQIKLMSETKVLAGPNGAAFANMIFGGQDLSAVCLSAREFIGSWYPDIAALCQQRFVWCLGHVDESARGQIAAPKVPYRIIPDDYRKSLEYLAKDRNVSGAR